MPLFAFEGAGRIASPAAWIAPTATLVGDLRVEAEASVWYEAAAAGVVPLRALAVLGSFGCRFAPHRTAIFLGT